MPAARTRAALVGGSGASMRVGQSPAGSSTVAAWAEASAAFWAICRAWRIQAPSTAKAANDMSTVKHNASTIALCFTVDDAENDAPSWTSCLLWILPRPGLNPRKAQAHGKGAARWGRSAATTILDTSHQDHSVLDVFPEVWGEIILHDAELWPWDVANRMQSL